MILKLYGSNFSGCTRRVATILFEKQVPFEFIDVNLAKGEHKTPEHFKKQPFGQVPYIDDDGFILFESRAISRYIAVKYANEGTPGLIPTDARAYALFEQAASMEQNYFDPFAQKAVFEKITGPMVAGLKFDQAAFDGLIAALSKKLDVYDQILSRQKYLAGDDLTLADLFHLPYGTMLSVAGSTVIDTKPNVARWLKDLQSRPSWQAVVKGMKPGISGP